MEKRSSREPGRAISFRRVAPVPLEPLRGRDDTVSRATCELDPLTVTAEVLHDFEQACRLEWLETNGAGGSASSTVIGANTRRYHSLLTVSTPRHGRLVLLNKLEETLHAGGESYPLSCNRYPGVIHPQGHLSLVSFHARPVPTWEFRLGRIRLRKRLALKHGRSTVAVEYTLEGGVDTATLELRPLLSFRDFHGLTHENLAVRTESRVERSRVVVRPYPELPALCLCQFDAFRPAPDWYRSFQYPVEAYRGLDFVEDLYCPGAMTLRLRAGVPKGILAGTEPGDRDAPATIIAAEVERKRRLAAQASVESSFARSLTVAADQFLVTLPGKRTTILAGYPWFSDWGRDTMIALPGLCLATNRVEEARDILAAFAALGDRGTIPNRLPEADAPPDYNTVDASLWMFVTVHEFVEATGDFDFVRQQLWDCLEEVIRYYTAGTRYGIRQDSDGLLQAGTSATQLTWMDAKVGDWVVTPRHGKAVEVNALWYNALRVGERLAQAFDLPVGERFGRQAEAVRRAFNEVFWNQAKGCLYDVVRGEEREDAVRPNQLFSVSLPYPVLAPARWGAVVEVCERELLTPVGLRSLSPADPSYQGHYGGDPQRRDGAYHRGTVWGWLLGPFVSAFLRVHGTSARSRARELLTGLEAHLTDAGLGTLSEIFDGDPPHTPRGCFAQAWTVGETLRVLTRLEGTHNPFEDQAKDSPSPADKGVG